MLEIICISDEEKNLINKNRKKYDLLISCGDLSPRYMDYVIEEFNPSFALMINGNHDEKYYPAETKEKSGFSEVFRGAYVLKQGYINLNRYIKKNIGIMGFSGALSWGAQPFHFQEKNISRFRKSVDRRKKLGLIKELDFFISHTPPYIQDAFKNMGAYHQPSYELGKLYESYFPKIWFYGHIHSSYTSQNLDFKLKKNNGYSFLINACPVKFILYDEEYKKLMDVTSIQKVMFSPLDISAKKQ